MRAVPAVAQVMNGAAHLRAVGRVSPRAPIAFLAAALALATLGCGEAIDPAEGKGFARCDELLLDSDRSPGQTNLILIVNDTMRRDRTGAYGGSARTPTFDAFAKANLMFEHAVSEANWTRPAVASLFTSLYPTQHGLAYHPYSGDKDTAEAVSVDALTGDFNTLAEELREAGYRTAAFVANPWLDEAFGYAQGFDIYDTSFAQWNGAGARISRAGLAWIRAQPMDRPYFLYLHYIDSHRPYGSLSPDDVRAAAEQIAADSRTMPEDDQNAISQIPLSDGTPILATGVELNPALLDLLYDRGLEDFDHSLRIVLNPLRRHPKWEDTAVIVTSDHGEALFERGYGNHANNLFEEEIAIPMAARLPGVRSNGSQVGCPVGLIDIMPSVCLYLGLDCDDDLMGKSFISSNSREPNDTDVRYLVSEGIPNRPLNRTIQNGRFKLIYEPSGRLEGDSQLHVSRDPWSLYDLSEDPHEERDLLSGWSAHRFGAVREVMAEALTNAISDRSRAPSEAVPLDAPLRQRLRELGYLEDQPE